MIDSNEHWMLGNGSYCISADVDVDDLLNDAEEWLECARAITSLLLESVRESGRRDGEASTEAVVSSDTVASADALLSTAALMDDGAVISTETQVRRDVGAGFEARANERQRILFALQTIDMLALMSAHCAAHAHSRIRWNVP